MKVLVQWANAAPSDYIEIDSTEWATLPRKPVPVGGETVDNTPGWLFDVMVQGISFAGADHYHVKDVAGGGVKVTAWWDDSEDQPPDQFKAEVWTLLPLAPDPRLGGAINTRQSRVIYAAPGMMARLNKNVENTEFRPWSEFVPPDHACHGIWVPDRNVPRHEDAQTPHGWREWTESLDPSELDSTGAGPPRVKGQRQQGRFAPAEGTKTFFLYDETLATGVHTTEHELRQEVTDLALPVNVSGATSPGAALQVFTWTTDSDEPNAADWPSGDYRCQIDVNLVMRVDSYGFLTLQGVAGHMARVNAGLTSDLETFEQTEAAFTGTGIKLATTGTIDPAAGATGDRWECILVLDATSESMAGSLRISVDNGDSFSDGPWAAAGATFERENDDNIPVVDEVRYEYILLRLFDDSIPVVDDPRYQYILHREFDDSIGFLDDIFTELFFQRQLDDTLSILDEIRYFYTLHRELDETLAIVDEPRYTYTLHREFDDSTAVVDDPRYQTILHRFFDETIPIVDEIFTEKVLIFTRELADAIAFVDDLRVFYTLHRELADTIAIADAIFIQLLIGGGLLVVHIRRGTF